MRVIIDDQLLSSHPAAPADIISLARQAALDQNRWVVEIRINGKPFTGEPSCLNPADVHEISIITQQPADLMHQVLQQSAAELEHADRIQRAAAADLQSGNTHAAMTRLADAFAIWQSVQKGLDLGAHTGMIELKGPLQHSLLRLRSHLASLRATIESRDSSALADHLLYDMPSVIQEWRSLLCDLDDAILTPPRS